MTSQSMLPGMAEKLEGMGRAQEHAPAEWLQAAIQAGRSVATRRPEFTTDPIWKVLELWNIPMPHEPRAMGPVMDALMKMGLCAKTDRVRPSVRPVCHRRPITVYQSLIYRERQV